MSPKLSDHLFPQLVLFTDAPAQNEVLHQLIEKAQTAGFIDDPDAFFQAVMDREKIVTTGIGMGVAIPHAKFAHIDQFFVVIGILSRGVDWHALDNSLVRLVFLIGGPDDHQTEYLNILSSLTVTLKDEDRRRRLLQATTPEQVLAQFTSLGSV